MKCLPYIWAMIYCIALGSAFKCSCYEHLTVDIERFSAPEVFRVSQGESIEACIANFCSKQVPFYSAESCKSLYEYVSINFPNASPSCCISNPNHAPMDAALTPTQRLLSFLESRGFLGKALIIESGSNGVRGVQLKEKASRGDVLFTVPVWDINLAKRSKKFGKYLRSFSGEQSDNVLLTLHLMLEKLTINLESEGVNALNNDYIDDEAMFVQLLLQSWPTTVVSFSVLSQAQADLLYRLAPVTWEKMMEKLNVEYEFIQSLYDSLIEILKENKVARLPPLSKMWGMWLWAVSTARSRTWYTQFVPIGDFFNHQRNASLFSLDQFQFHLKNASPASTPQVPAVMSLIKVESLGEYEMNSEIFDDYDYEPGVQSSFQMLCNIDLFHKYGFTEDISDRACVDMRVVLSVGDYSEYFPLTIRSSDRGIPSTQVLSMLYSAYIVLVKHRNIQIRNEKLCAEWKVMEALVLALSLSRAHDKSPPINSAKTFAFDAPVVLPFHNIDKLGNHSQKPPPQPLKRSAWGESADIEADIETIGKGVEETVTLAMQYVEMKKKELLIEMEQAGVSVLNVCESSEPRTPDGEF